MTLFQEFSLVTNNIRKYLVRESICSGFRMGVIKRKQTSRLKFLGGETKSVDGNENNNNKKNVTVFLILCSEFLNLSMNLASL